MSAAAWRVALVAAALTALAQGGRQVFGLFLSPLNTASGLGLAWISLAMAVGQLGLGLSQAMIGAWADRSGPMRVILLGSLVLAASTAMPTASLAGPVLFASLVTSVIAGSAVGSNGLLLGPVSRAATPAHAGLAIGIVGAGASLGQLLLGPLLQWLIDGAGWRTALLALAALSLLGLPLATGLRERGDRAVPAQARGSISDALRDRDFWKAALSFAVCGLHVAFLGAHMPGAIERCGFPAALAGPWMALAGAGNIAGSVGVGLLMRRADPGHLLAGIYAIRALGIVGFVLSPSSVAGLMLFGLVMGASHMATLPPTTALISRRFGTDRLGALFGGVMLVHQAGAFMGVWLGGWLAGRSGGDGLFWMIDIGFAFAAAALVWPRGRLTADAAARSANP
ncbi:MFS transporter [Ramlibacter henchirensis]|uniref:MFS transporter n=1 Tax=Ramlibacter henchirensis TaxID=204072 RepID=A0A4Z0C1V3_9BURK|nr:MFS transporter [Ramlibacter henchirensis]TFZ05506.1 MFS transporter [Ramlibacter henchirensis]